MNKRIVVSGGGTGGHIYPAIGIANALIKLDAEIEIIFIGGADRLESTIVPQYGFRFLAISVAGFPRKLTWKWFPVIGKVGLGIMQSLRLLKQLNPSIAVGTGGYVSGPVLFAASLRGIPTVIQDQNVAPGLTNRLLGRCAKAAYLSFETAAARFPDGIVQITGNPIRPTIASFERNPETYEKFGLDPALKTVCVMGGSQGAHAINQVVMAALNDLTPLHEQVQIIHQTGKTDYKDVQNCYSNSGLRHLVSAYFDPVEEVYSIADLMVCRAGGMTVSEVTACGIPAIFIPLPAMAGNNQRLNAKAVEEQGGCILLDQNTLTGTELAGKIMQLLADSERLREMADASRALGNPQASEDIAKSIYAFVSRN
jgi:UDP-N-acetylglucosamine--N-acetylmuramyl-(pentapeptide) pyrophosphoryl-undecaprenol N-acetylglucosamine transferase